MLAMLHRHLEPPLHANSYSSDAENCGVCEGKCLPHQLFARWSTGFGVRYQPNALLLLPLEKTCMGYKIRLSLTFHGSFSLVFNQTPKLVRY